tara:strand:+ start:2494 stop:3126 length:633 start_codon:yes stop_codon:yes gene_type:complete
MDRDRSGWITLVIISLLFLVLYIESSYSSLFERRPAYLYEPHSDDIYYLELAPWTSPNIKWKVFNPFYSIQYTEPDAGEYLGKLSELIEKIERDKKLLKEDFDAWFQNRGVSFELGKKLANGTVEMEYWEFDYFVRFDEQPNESFLEILSPVLGDFDNNKSKLLLVDAVAVKNVSNLDKPELNKPHIIKILKSAILLKGQVANQLFDAGL